MEKHGAKGGAVYTFICFKREWLKFSFGQQCGLSIGLSVPHLFSPVCPAGADPPDVWISVCKWQAAPERCPRAPSLPAFQRPGDLVAVICQGGDVNVWWQDNPSRAEPRVACLFDRLINGNPPRKTASICKRIRGEETFPLSPGHQGLKPGLLW